jgi:acylphosphatase
MDYEILKRLLAALESRGVKYAIFGAVALNLHGLVRNTEDLDIFIAPEQPNVELLKAALRDAIDDPEIENITADDLLGECTAVRYVPPEGPFYIDVVTRIGEAFAFSDLETERVPYQDLTVTVVTPRMLYKMKKDTVRPKDRIDAEVLRRTFDLEPD